MESFFSTTVPPSWSVAPEDGSVSLGGSLRAPCEAEGFPVPSVSWQRETGNVHK